MKRVLVTCPPMLRVMKEYEPRFRAAGLEPVCPDVVQTLTEEQLLELVPGVDGWIIGDDPASRRVFTAGRSGRLRAAVKWGVGVDNVDFAAARDLGIPIDHTPGVFGREVADLAMGYVVALARETHAIDAAVRAGGWPKPTGISLAGRTLGLAGYGDIGRNVARRALAADLKLVVYDPALQALAEPAARLATWPERLEECDFLVLTCALHAGNRHMLNAAALARAKPGVRVVNVARGGLIDQDALVAAMRAGTVHSAALDVFETEPLPMNSPLRTLDRCIFGSHNGSNTLDAVRRATDAALATLLKFLGGRPA
jgi:D-3-phosphoglycerate dehydrogenase